MAAVSSRTSTCVEHRLQLGGSVRPVLAMGAWFKNSLCVTVGQEALISGNLGDLDTPQACRAHEETAWAMLDLLGEKPCCIVHDLHPDFHSSRFAAALAAQLQVPLLAVQHHHAHIAAVAAEHGHHGALLGLALDGVGLGSDGGAWGGELLYMNGAECQRLGHLYPLPLPGGDRAAREPWRMAAAALHELDRNGEIATRFARHAGAATVAAMLQRKLNCPRTSSMGRLFDAAAGLLGVCEKMEFEAQAAIALEQLAKSHGPVEPMSAGYTISPSPSLTPCPLPEGEGVLEGWGRGGVSAIPGSHPLPSPLPSRERGKICLDFRPLLAKLAACNDAAYGAALFHATVAAGLAAWVAQAAAEANATTIALGGGCFLNQVMTQALLPALAAQGLKVLQPIHLSPGDSAVSLGQAFVAQAASPAIPSPQPSPTGREGTRRDAGEAACATDRK